jgi:hypothetical protein
MVCTRSARSGLGRAGSSWNFTLSGSVDARCKRRAGSSSGGFNDLGVLRSALLLASVDNLDGLKGSGLVGPLVLCARAVVDDLDAFDCHREWPLGEIGLAACPFNGALIRRATTGPGPETNVARCLRVSLSAIGITVLQGSNGLAINDPGKRLCGPVQSVGVHLGLAVGHGILDHAIENGRVSSVRTLATEIYLSQGWFY